MPNLSNLHHAYLLLGGCGEAENFVRGIFGDLGGSPDYLVFKEELFGVDDARKVADLALRKSFGERKIFFISPDKITAEAQNALLKTFEEPVEGTHFFLNLSDASVILPTLRSRLESVNLLPSTPDKEAEKFLNLPLKGRLNFAKNFEGNLAQFLDELLLLRRDRAVFRLRLLAHDRAASSRLVLEHLALVL